MIIKHIPITKKENSNFKRVANYIVSTKGTDNRIARIKITNCESEDIDGAILEVIATQKHNTRSKNDKNYHFIISFKSGEVPSDNILDSIENYVCNALKMSSHQRISAVHTDTDNLHIHVVVNKINKTSFNMIEPYYPYKTFAKCCEYLEQKFNLQLDNHSPVLSVSEAKIKDLEAFTSIGSFVGFIREIFLDDILKAQNWQELHLKLNKKGIVIQQKGNGLVFTNGTLYVKASSVSREISKNRLEKKLGKFIVFNNLNIKIEFFLNKGVDFIGFSPLDVASDSFSRKNTNLNAAYLQQKLIGDKETLQTLKSTFLNENSKLTTYINRKYSEQKISWCSTNFLNCINYYLDQNNPYIGSENMCVFPLTSVVLDYNGDLKNCFYSSAFGNIYDPNNIDWKSTKTLTLLKNEHSCINCRGKVFCG